MGTVLGGNGLQVPDPNFHLIPHCMFYKVTPQVGWVHEGPPYLLQPLNNPTCSLSRRLRSVKIEQGKLNDQANTLAELAKVSRAGWGGSPGEDSLPAMGGTADR